jgi:TfoX/Sxy family transcriptional regulator of competence genes
VAYDEVLVARVRAALVGDGVEERRVVGGLGFLKDGTMLGGVDRRGLYVRVAPGDREAALAGEHVDAMTIGGRETKSFVAVAAAGIADDADLRRWLRVGLAAAGSLAGQP